MSKAKHTPGPWQRQGSHICTADPERAILAQVFNPGKRPGDYPLTENANLIAAAPEMLEALEKAKQFIQNGIQYGYINMPDKDCGDSALETPAKIEAAIQKARGHG